MSVKKLSFKQTQIKFAKAVPQTLDVTVTSITAAAPAVLTATVDLKDADVVYIKSAAAPQIEGFYQVKKMTANTYQLSGSDFTVHGAVNDAKLGKVEMSAFCAATSLDIEPATTSSTATTTNCDDYPQEETEIEAGSASMDIYWNPDDEVQEQLEGLLFSGEKTFFQHKPKETQVVTGFRANVDSFSYNGAVGEKYQGSVGFKLQSKPMKTRVA